MNIIKLTDEQVDILVTIINNSIYEACPHELGIDTVCNISTGYNCLKCWKSALTRKDED